MSGSTPEPDAVTASGGTAEGATPSRAAIRARRWLTALSRFGESPARFEAPEVDGSPGPSTSFAVAEGRVWKYGSVLMLGPASEPSEAGFAATGSTPISAEPAGVPCAVITEPSALPASPGRWATPHTASG